MKTNDPIGLSDKITVKGGNNMKDGIEILGEFNLLAILRGPDGTEKKRQTISNQVQTYMKTHVADKVSDKGENDMGWMSIGSGSGQGVGDTELASEETREALDGGTPTHSGPVITYHRTFAATEGTATITEAGVHESAAAGSMGVYTDALNFAKGIGDSLELTWTLTVS